MRRADESVAVLQVRVPDETIDALDRLAGSRSREEVVRALLVRGVRGLEANPRPFVAWIESVILRGLREVPEPTLS